MIRVFDFVCADGHSTELFVHSGTTQSVCGNCGKQATRVISKPNFKLNGVDGSFPTASDKWAQVHEQAAAVSNKKYLEHGSL